MKLMHYETDAAVNSRNDLSFFKFIQRLCVININIYFLYCLCIMYFNIHVKLYIIPFYYRYHCYSKLQVWGW